MSDDNTTPQDPQGSTAQDTPRDAPQSGSRWEPRTDASNAPAPPMPPADVGAPVADAGPPMPIVPAPAINAP